MKVYSIENDILKISACDHQGELYSVQSKKTGTEYLWQGDSKFWGDRAIIPFPIFGRLYKGQYTYEGNFYSLGCHGLIHGRKTYLKEMNENEIAFEYTSDEETKKDYPFDFTFEMRYVLEGNTVKNIFKVTNTGDKGLYFSTGGHPGINIPFNGGDFSDYYVEFPQASDEIKVMDIDESYLFAGTFSDYKFKDGKYLDLYHSMFDNDALFFSGTGKKAIIRNKNNDSASVEFDYDSYYLGLWHRPKTEAPYCCIEPINGIPSYCDRMDELTTKRDMIYLAPNEDYTFAFNITINEK